MIETLKNLYFKWIEPWSQGSSPMEIRRAILDEVEGHAVAIGDGKKIFPFDRLRIHLRADGPEQRAVLEGVIQEGWDLERAIQRLLERIDCRVPGRLDLRYHVSEEDDPRFDGRSYFVEYQQTESLPADGGRPVLELQVVQGTATEETYVTSASRIHIGRSPEVLDRHGRLERRNEIAFAEDGEINATVSRQHATIRYDDDSRSYWVRDNNSAGGTRIFRSGQPLSVGRHRQGVRLRDGDELSLGRAQILVKIQRSE